MRTKSKVLPNLKSILLAIPLLLIVIFHHVAHQSYLYYEILDAIEEVECSNTDFDQMKSYIYDLIADCRIEEALVKCLELVQEHYPLKEKEIRHLQFQYTCLMNFYCGGIISPEQAIILQAGIVWDFLVELEAISVGHAQNGFNISLLGSSEHNIASNLAFIQNTGQNRIDLIPEDLCPITCRNK